MPWTLDMHLKQLHREGILLEPYCGTGKSTNLLRRLDGKVLQREPKREIQRIYAYLEKLPTELYQRLRRLASQLPPMHKACRAVILVPCRYESPYIERFLDIFAYQKNFDWLPLPTEQYEIILLNNRYEDEPDDGFAQKVSDWKTCNPHAASVGVLELIYSKEEQTPLTTARKTLCDLALYRAVKRTSYDSPLYLLFEDADCTWADLRQTAFMIQRFDSNPALDALRGGQDRCPWILCLNDYLILLRRSWNFSEILLSAHQWRPGSYKRYDFNWNRVVTSGWNTAVTAEVYAQVGGYTPFRRFEEDMDLGERISVLRGSWFNNEFVPHVNTVGRIPTRSEGSPRRWIYRCFSGIEPYDPRDNFDNFFNRFHERVFRTTAIEQLLAKAESVARIRQAPIQVFEELLTRDLNFVQSCLSDVSLGCRLYRRVLVWLGLAPDDFRFVSDRVELLHIDRLATALEKFREQNAHLRPAWSPPKPHRRYTWRTKALIEEIEAAL